MASRQRLLAARYSRVLADGMKEDLVIAVSRVGEITPGVGVVVEVRFSGELRATLPGVDELQVTCMAVAFIASEIRRDLESGVVYYHPDTPHEVDFADFFGPVALALGRLDHSSADQG